MEAVHDADVIAAGDAWEGEHTLLRLFTGHQGARFVHSPSYDWPEAAEERARTPRNHQAVRSKKRRKWRDGASEASEVSLRPAGTRKRTAE